MIDFKGSCQSHIVTISTIDFDFKLLCNIESCSDKFEMKVQSTHVSGFGAKNKTISSFFSPTVLHATQLCLTSHFL